MAEYLVFALVAPMGAFGDLAGHEQRGSAGWPGRSAILGLMGAALGVRRDDATGQDALSDWRMAVSILHRGSVLNDFHTVQTVPSTRIKRPATRAEALRALNRSDNGLITRRSYRMDCAFGVALWGGDTAALEVALKAPHFVPYLGRKSCPLSAPMAPKRLEAEGPLQALAYVTLPPFLALDPAAPLFVASDIPLGEGRSETRHDIPLDREKWHFAAREVHIHRPEDPR
jgi:CRISPR system Cascade subunit CasD